MRVMQAVVGMSVTFVHLNPNIFPEPGRFSPERWLDSGAELDKYLVSFSKYVFCHS